MLAVTRDHDDDDDDTSMAHRDGFQLLIIDGQKVQTSNKNWP